MNLLEKLKSIFWPPALNRATGVDVSYYQDNNYTPQQINWPVLAKKATFAFIRAGFGGSVDSDFAYNWHNSRQAGIPRGAYWYLTSAVPATKAAYLFVIAMGGDFGELPPIADYEWQSWSSNGTARLYLRDFLEEVYRLTGKRCIIYTSASRWFAWGSADVYWKQYELWVAHYNVDTPTIPRPWTSWLFWQYGTPTINPAEWGVESLEIDADYFNGTAAEFYQRFGLTTIPAPIPDPQPIPDQFPPVLNLVSISPVPTEKTTILINAELADGDKIPYVLTYTPATPPSPPAPSNLYRFDVSDMAKMQSWGWAPPVNFLFYRLYERKPAGGMVRMATIALPSAWRAWLVSLQMLFGTDAATAEKVVQWAERADAGPMQGGIGKWIVADTPGGNDALTVTGIVAANDGKQYAAIDYIDATKAPPAVTRALRDRHVVHWLYQLDTTGKLTPPSGLAGLWIQPIISKVQPYVLLSDLVKA